MTEQARARASADLMHQAGRSKLLSCRILFRKTGSHFCGECSKFLFYRILFRKTGIHFCGECSIAARTAARCRRATG
ncbi:hypothetical protein F1193_02590 [Blastochloris sulfoviridis]|uniref:Uncharacterized protein n=1 Tax=Blastochloris sulfoviridis TaxID=50712 RepID=A0A5M6I4M9_9HYPH|nr:hypothetical protein F1193_02590 [Blastochloris sulfoviridis]